MSPPPTRSPETCRRGSIFLHLLSAYCFTGFPDSSGTQFPENQKSLTASPPAGVAMAFNSWGSILSETNLTDPSNREK
jgi:hypothetical protein